MRSDIDEYFMSIAKVVATRSTCKRHQIGAVAVKDKRILTTGYNGAPSKLKDCLQLGCLRDEQKIPSGVRTEVCRAVHAEENVIIQAGIHGVNLQGATMYCTHSPCRRCAKMMVNAGIARVVYKNDYQDAIFRDLFDEANIRYELLHDVDVFMKIYGKERNV